MAAMAALFFVRDAKRSLCPVSTHKTNASPQTGFILYMQYVHEHGVCTVKRRPAIRGFATFRFSLSHDQSAQPPKPGVYFGPPLPPDDDADSPRRCR